jgi:hypothetical protein
MRCTLSNLFIAYDHCNFGLCRFIIEKPIVLKMNQPFYKTHFTDFSVYK